jgi:hypothetical protein
LEIDLAEDLDERIRENASGPQRAKGDSTEMEQHSLPDQIAADRYLASKAAAKKKGLGIRTVKLAAPAAL